MSTELREFLDRRERELVEALDALYADARPKEIELSEIRRVKHGLLQTPSADRQGDGRSKPRLVLDLRYSSLTMKQLVVKVLTEHFPDGATTQQMRDFFRDAWGRNIERQNLSPQLSRLYQAGVIGREGRVWFMAKAAPSRQVAEK